MSIGFNGDQFKLPGVNEVSSESENKAENDGLFSAFNLKREVFEIALHDYLCQLADEEYGSNNEKHIANVAKKILSDFRSGSMNDVIDFAKKIIRITNPQNNQLMSEANRYKLGSIALETKKMLNNYREQKKTERICYDGGNTAVNENDKRGAFMERSQPREDDE